MGIRKDGTYSKGNPRVTIRLEREALETLERQCKKTGVKNISGYIRKLIQKDIEGEEVTQN